MNYYEAQNYKHETLRLYKYISVRALTGFIEHGDIKITYKSDANDPYESSPKGIHPGLSKSCTHGFLSLTKSRNNHSMWGTYADKFRGACLQFDIPYFTYNDAKSHHEVDNILATFTDIFQQTKITNDNKNYYSVDCRFMRFKINDNHVLLEDEDTIISCLYTHERYNPDSPIYIPDEINTSYRNLLEKNLRKILSLATKEKSWEHEQEYRVPISLSGITRSLYGEHPMFFSKRLSKFISGIILAPFCPFDEKTIKSMLRCNKDSSIRNIPVEKVFCNVENYELTQSSINLTENRGSDTIYDYQGTCISVPKDIDEVISVTQN